ncbi:MAG: type 1 glutamine amidotransferase [Alphaproteobacteria bacterium]|nr:type 1 glutamine amidotransferase [Alphaproteobacteria bacterium]
MGGPKLLVMDGYPRATREGLVAAGVSIAGELYARTLRRFVPTATIDIHYAADADSTLPAGVTLGDYDGIAWTGSTLSVCDAGTPEVDRQIELARAVFDCGVPSFGSCWAVQVNAAAAGGVVARNPLGREVGLARKVVLTIAGRAHPLYQGKPGVFDSFASHEDEITHLPHGASVLAGNALSRIQAVEIRFGAGCFWGVQYHPEFDLREIARLMFFRLDRLVGQGFFADRGAGMRVIADFEALHQDPSRSDLAWRYGLDADVLDADERLCEVGNWVREQVLRGAR